MKKTIAIITLLALSITLAACRSSESAATATSTATESTTTTTFATQATDLVTEPVAVEKERDFPEGEYLETGVGTIYVATPSGTSEDGKIPVLYVSSDTLLTEIGLDAWDFNGSALSFVYIDGMLAEKTQLANTQTSLALDGDMLSVGTHVVEVVQYENDDPSGIIITYKCMQYEIKES